MPIKIEQLNVEIFGGCNFGCTVCPQSDAMGGRERDFLKLLPFSLFEKVVNDAMQYGLKAVSLHGSGEPTLHKELEKMVRFASQKGLHVSFFTNGLRLTGQKFEQLLLAGLSLATVSLIGANRESYRKAMDQDSFDAVLNNLHACAEVTRRYPGRGEFHTRHLIVDPTRREEEVAEYRRNIIDPLGCKAEIWEMHNWAGQLAADYNRFAHAPPKLRSCGRPFAATLEVRAGGLDKHYAAVVPCPFVLGKDSQAVLGHLDSQTIAAVMGGMPLAELRLAHTEERFDDISYCKGCDMLANDPEVLAWSNIPGRYVGQSKTSKVDYPAASPAEAAG